MTTTYARSWTWCSCSSSPAGRLIRIDRASPRAECRIFGWCGSTSSVRRSQCSMRGSVLRLGLRAASRRRLIAWRMMRETCIWDTPTRVADLGLREVLGEAQAQDLALALAEHAHQALDRRASPRRCRTRGPRSRTRRRCRRRPRRRSRGRSRLDRAVGARPPRAPRAPARRVVPVRLAISAGVAARPSSRASSSPTGSSSTASSCRSRGTRTDQPLSRKWRLSSPRMVGTAKLENAVSRLGSKRSIAFSSPRLATWMRSSSGSPPRW